jgi:hypothetical protein
MGCPPAHPTSAHTMILSEARALPGSPGLLIHCEVREPQRKTMSAGPLACHSSPKHQHLRRVGMVPDLEGRSQARTCPILDRPHPSGPAGSCGTGP